YLLRSPSPPLHSYSYRHHPAPPSFPTRRSSDLWSSPSPRRSKPKPRPSFAPRPATRRPALPHTVRVQACNAWWSSPKDASRRARSEEHTSELQSRFDLVCRLLLEKKKKTSRTIS